MREIQKEGLQVNFIDEDYPTFSITASDENGVSIFLLRRPIAGVWSALPQRGLETEQGVLNLDVQCAIINLVTEERTNPGVIDAFTHAIHTSLAQEDLLPERRDILQAILQQTQEVINERSYLLRPRVY